MRYWIVKAYCVIAVLLITGVVFANPAAPVPMLLPPSSEPSVSANSTGDNLQITVYEVELGQTLLIPIPNSSFHLVQSPQFVTVSDNRPEGLDVRGEKIGETLILIWGSGGVQSVRVRVLRPSIESAIIERVLEKSSQGYQSRRDRTFKLGYESAYSLLAEDRVLGRVSESRKLFGQRMRGYGPTPIGDVRANMFYEYRKEHSLEKSVSIPRDITFGLYESELPLVKRYDFQGGTQYMTLDRFGFPGARYSGFSMQPSLSRVNQPRRGQTDVTWFAGAKRDGSIVDNPAGIQNRELQGKVTGERVDHYLWPGGKVSLSAAHQWDGPRSELEAKHNVDSRFHFRLPYVELEGEGGLDPENRAAGDFRAAVQNNFAGLQGRYYNVDNNYATVTGSVQNRANRGMELNAHLFPLLPLAQSDAVSLRGGAGWVHNDLSVNPESPSDYTKWQQGTLSVRLPARVLSDTSVFFLDQRASAFPFTQRRLQQEFSREFSLNSRLVPRVRLGLFTGAEIYRHSEDSPGFNSTRYEAGTSASASLRGGFWLQARYARNRLKEEDLSVEPRATTYPDQTTLSGGWSRTFRRVPLSVNADIRYVNENSTYGKIHQPFFNEDRLEAHAGLTVPVRDSAQFYVDSSIALTKSTIGAPDHAEFSLLSGMRMLLDTKLYIPRKGTVEGFMFSDLNLNGIHDAGEPGMAGYKISEEGGAGTQTNAQGYYRLKIKEGHARISAASQIPDGFFYTTANWQELEILPKAKTKINFGVAAQFQVKGRAYVDVNHSGTYDAGDTAIPKIQLVLSSGQTTVTSPDGFYNIQRVPPGANKIRISFESIPVGYRTETAIEKKIEAAPGDVYHFDVILTPLRIVSGYVFEDLNQNHAKEPDEPGIARVELLMDGRKVRTGKKGRYQLADLEPGLRKISLIRESVPHGYAPLVQSQSVEVPTGPFQKTDMQFPLRKSFHKDQATA